MSDLHHIITQTVEALPRWCKGLEGDLESHEWIYTQEPAGFTRFGLDPKRRAPHFICKFCHAVSEPYTTHLNPKRAR